MKKYKRIALVVGHSKLKNGSYTSATGVKNEYLYNKELGNQIKKWFDEIGQPCDLIICPEGKFISAKEEQNYKLPLVNNGNYDLIIELHLNAFDGSGKGTEVLYASSNGEIVAQRIQNKLKTIFVDRKIKRRDNLYMLTKTKPVAIIVESFFCDNKNDCNIADSKGTKEIARLIVEGVVDTTVKEVASENTYVVTCDILNVRKNRGSEYEKVGTLKKGDKVEIWEIAKDSKGENWGSFRYSFNPDIIGFVHMGYLDKI